MTPLFETYVDGLTGVDVMHWVLPLCKKRWKRPSKLRFPSYSPYVKETCG
jgi:hypothetical protein